MSALILGRCHGAFLAPVNAGRERVLDELIREPVEWDSVAGVQLELRFQRAWFHQPYRHAVRAEDAGRLCGRRERQGKGKGRKHGELREASAIEPPAANE